MALPRVVLPLTVRLPEMVAAPSASRLFLRTILSPAPLPAAWRTRLPAEERLRSPVVEETVLPLILT